MNRIKIIFAALVVSFAALANSAYAQGTTGQISGVVTDPNGAVVQDANVTATSLDTNFSRSQMTGEDGVYAFQLLPPGRYRVLVTSSGFQETSVEAVIQKIFFAFD